MNTQPALLECQQGAVGGQMVVHYGPGQSQVPLKQWEQVEQRRALADRGTRSHLSQHPLLLPHKAVWEDTRQ